MGVDESPTRIRELIALYHATHYDVLLPAGAAATLRIGEGLPAALRGWIDDGHGAFFISACNPCSQQLSPAENEGRHLSLRERLRLSPCRVLEGTGHVPGATWREPSLFVTDIDMASIDRLATEFGQNAIVFAPSAGNARLRLYRTDWLDALRGEAGIDWAASTPGA